MRKVNYILAGLATIFMASCSNEDAPVNGNTGDGNASFLSVKITNPTGSRADGDGYEDGTGIETKVNTMVFYLFDKNGAAFPLKDDTKPNRDFNKVEAEDFGEPNEGTGDIESVYNPVLVIKHEKGEIPAYIVAVINTDLGDKVANITELKGKLDAAYGSETSFVMSNAMTADGELTPVTAANLAETVELAKANPVKIDVERVLAKVRTDFSSNNNNSNVWETGETVDNTAAGAKLYARLDGWTVTNTATTSYLLKNVDGITDETAWPGWSNDHRSFWANTTGIDVSAYETPYEDITKPDQVYLMENTNQNNPTTVIVKATIVDAAGNPVTLARWNGIQYANLDDGLTELKTAMLAFLQGQNRLPWVATESGRTTMRISDFTFTVDTDQKWKAVPGPIAGTQFFATAEAATPMTEAEVNAVFNMLGTAMIWTGGHTYYHTTIKHSVDGVTDNRTGVVRNHIYDINITDVQGLGTPVYDPEQVYDPEDPEYTESSLYAEVRILSFRLVSNNAVLGGE